MYVGHDYTILAWLAALGVKEHPPEIMGFGAFAIMEYWRHRETGIVTQRLMLQALPFPDSTTPTTMTMKKPIQVYEKIL